MKAQGKGIKPIMRELGLAKETVRKFYWATSVEKVTATSRAGRPSVLDEFEPYLHERFNAGITNVSALFREIREQGYRGSLSTVIDYLAPFRTVGAAPPAKPAVPKVQHVTSWMLHHPDDLDEWMTAVEADDLPHLHRFVRGLRGCRGRRCPGALGDRSFG